MVTETSLRSKLLTMAQRATAPCRPTVTALWQLLSQLTFNMTNNCKNQLCLHTKLAARTWRKRALWSLAPSCIYNIVWRSEFHLFVHGQYRPELAYHTSGKTYSNSETTHFPNKVLVFFIIIIILHASLNKCSRVADTTLSLKANTTRHNTAYKNRLFSLYILVVLAKQKSVE
jgi:hypothetical protein